eukprot:m.89975 g.89975  ORF g.89975 m.89975 type:complete len:63 (-) comp20109_c0_seq2:525-713(-)
MYGAVVEGPSIPIHEAFFQSLSAKRAGCPTTTREESGGRAGVQCVNVDALAITGLQCKESVA